MGRTAVAEKYGNLFEMYQRITAEDPYEVPMRIYPAIHYTMGGLWVDYDLQTTVPGLFAIGEANFSDHGANRLGASALMQGLADGYFVLPATLNDYLARHSHEDVPADHPAVTQAVARGRRATAASADERRRPHRRLLPPGAGRTAVGTLRHGPRPRPGCARRCDRIPELRDEFWRRIRVPGGGASSTSRWRRPTASPTSWSWPS